MTSYIYIFYAFLICSCLNYKNSSDYLKDNNENHAKRALDLTASKNSERKYLLDFMPGDQFILKKDMFLHVCVSNVIELGAPGDGLPSPRAYHDKPSAFSRGGINPYQVIRFVPRGTVIRLEAIKENSQAGFLTYFVFDGESDWFRSSIFRMSSDNKLVHSYTYNREYFSKLPSES